jgi:hypothetical protein
LTGGTAPFVTKFAAVSFDDIPPVTTATLSAAPNSYGWNNTTVTLDLNAADNPGSGVKQIQYFTYGAQSIDWQVVAGNDVKINISAQGTTWVSYYATDNAGNEEKAKLFTVRIDLTPPMVAVTGVSNGALYYFNAAPTPGCISMDGTAGVANAANLTVEGGNGSGYGTFTATCAGAANQAGNLAAPVSVTYTINGPTSLRGTVKQETSRQKGKVWQIEIRNNGPGTAYGAEITNLSLQQIVGKACTPSPLPALPIPLGDILPSRFSKVSVWIDFSGCGSNAEFEVTGSITANNGTSVGGIMMSGGHEWFGEDEKMPNRAGSPSDQTAGASRVGVELPFVPKGGQK